MGIIPFSQLALRKVFFFIKTNIPGDHILFYGDSLTDQARGPKGWVTIVRETVKEKHPDLGLEVTTFAIGGYCIVDRVKRVDQEVLAKKPTIVVLQGGVPDALRYNRDQFKTGLEELIERLQKANVRVVVCSCTSLGEKHDGSLHAFRQLLQINFQRLHALPHGFFRGVEVVQLLGGDVGEHVELHLGLRSRRSHRDEVPFVCQIQDDHVGLGRV